jgi:NAD(P)H dehydrogenase (quinone)
MIALLGSTGTIGAHVATELAERAIPARALVRDPSRSELPWVAVDLRDPASLREGLTGASTLFLLTPHGPDQDLLEAVAIDAAVASGVGRIVKLSGGAPSLGPNGPTTTAVAHWRGEQRIEASGLRFCFLRSSFLMQNLLATAAPMVRNAGILAAPLGRAPIAMVDARDVAACAVAALTDDEAEDCAWHLTGPRGVSYPDLASWLGVRYLNVPRGLAARALRRQGASPWEVDHSLRMAAYFAAGSDSASTDAVVRLTGRPPRSIDDFLVANADAFGGLAGVRTPSVPTRLLSLIPIPKGT